MNFIKNFSAILSIVFVLLVSGCTVSLDEYSSSASDLRNISG